MSLRIFELTDGTTTVRMAKCETQDVSSVVRQGIQASSIVPHIMDEPAQSIEKTLVTESYNVLIKARDADSISDKIDKLIYLLRRAWLRYNKRRYRKPVYLIQRAYGETNTRYAPVAFCVEMNMPAPLFDPYFEQDNLIRGGGITIARYAWREGIPGTLPDPVTLTKTDAPDDDTQVMISNHQDIYPITHLIQYDASAAAYKDLFRAVKSTDDFESETDADGDLNYTEGDDLMEVTFDDANSAYGIIDPAQIDMTGGIFEIDFDPESVAVDDTKLMNLIDWRDGAANSYWNVQFSNSGGTLQVRADAYTDGGAWSGSSYVDVPDGIKRFKVIFERSTGANDGYMYLYFDDVLVVSLDGIDNDTRDYDTIRFGMCWTNSVAFGGSFKFGNITCLFTSSACFDLFPAAPAVNDIVYIGGSKPFSHFCFEQCQAGDAAGDTIKTYAYDGAWTEQAIGEDFTVFPEETEEDLMDVAAETLCSINFNVGDGWQTVAVNARTKYWTKLQITALTTWVTPVKIKDVYTQKTPEMRIANDVLGGNISPYLHLRLYNPGGSDTDPELGTLSRAVVGLRTEDNLDSFCSRLNLGNVGNAEDYGITITYGDDTSSIANEASPGGYISECTFATDSDWDWRVRVKIDSGLANYLGEFRPFVRVHQNSGDAGDVSMFLIARIGSTDDDAPIRQGPTVECVSNVLGEVVDLWPNEFLKLPFTETANEDELDADIYLELWAKRNAGASYIYWMDLILIPCDEWISDLNDPISSSETGNSALRGDTLLDIDSGIIDNRTIKQIILSDGTIVPAETWSRRSNPMRIEPGVDARLYFLMGHYYVNEGWGQPPFISENGMMLAAELRKQNIHLYLRGDD